MSESDLAGEDRPKFETYQCYHDGQGFESLWACTHHVEQLHPEFGPASCRQVTLIACGCGETFTQLGDAEKHTVSAHGVDNPQEGLSFETAEE